VTGGGSAGTLDYLRNNPQFQQLRQVVQQQPQMLEPILNQLAQGNPELAARISQSPEEFLALLSEDADDDAALPPGAQAISVTEEEREAIERVSPFANYRCLSDFIALPSWLRTRHGHPGVLCVR
jgi:UV excision repair protein RAD23